MPPTRLDAQIRFILEIEQLKSVIRRSELINLGRYENSAEHSWHIAMLAIILAEHANAEVDLLRVVKMLLVHDIVEIDAGDTYAYDTTARVDQHDREAAAAQRIFGLLPADQASELISLWEEFDARATAEAKFANAVDRLMPLFHNYYSQGRAWQSHGVTRDQVTERLSPIEEGSTELWTLARSFIDDAVSQGFLAP
ncbi:MAG: HD domain-containing protein [Caldilineaceae bacterium]|nr:HD domain-containing protein [Caldilineaceae bacterium]